MDAVDALTSGPVHHFRDWPNRDVPEAAIGVYTIWHQDGRFIYVGMSGRQPRTDRTRWGNFYRQTCRVWWLVT